MEDLFLRKFNSYKDFKKQFIEWQDQNFQLITVSKSDKLNPKLFCEATVARFEYERVFFQCKKYLFNLIKIFGPHLFEINV